MLKAILLLALPISLSAQVISQPPMVSAPPLDTATIIVLPSMITDIVLQPISSTEIRVQWIAVDIEGSPASYWVSIHPRGPIPVQGMWGAAPEGSCQGLVSGRVEGMTVECVAGGLEQQVVYDFLITPVPDTASTAPFPDLEIVTTSLPSARFGFFYTAQLRATGGDGTYRWRISREMLPDGLALNPETGVISGVPLQLQAPGMPVPGSALWWLASGGA